jgi:serine/threonine-protein kinase
VVAIHAAGVVHRDLKPANIYLTHDENGEMRAKILDFGIARVEWEEMRITNMGAPLGTPGYMSPEQETGAEVDVRSDVYAIGAVLYECFVGEPPPALESDMWTPGKRPPSVRFRLPHEGDEGRPSRPDSGVHPASRRLASAPPAPVPVPEAWREIIEKALAKRPEHRFQEARSLLAAIRSLRAQSLAPPALSST